MRVLVPSILLSTALSAQGMMAAPNPPTDTSFVDTSNLERIAGGVQEVRDAMVHGTETQAHETASWFFENIQRNPAEVHYRPRGWEKPDPDDARPASEDNFRIGLRKALLNSRVPSQDLDVYRLYSAGERVHMDSHKADEVARGGVLLDSESSRLLKEHEYGMFEKVEKSQDRSPLEMVRIILTKQFKKLAGFLPFQWLVLVYAHEAAHALQHFRGELDPHEHKKAEVFAFTMEARMADMIDPKGHILSRLLQDHCVPPADRSGAVCQYISHVASVRRAWEMDLKISNGSHMWQLVQDLGYSDDGHELARPH